MNIFLPPLPIITMTKKERKVLKMSPKELLYIDDVLGHETNMKAACTDFASKIQNAELKSFVSELAQKHTQCFNKFYGLLNG